MYDVDNRYNLYTFYTLYLKKFNQIHYINFYNGNNNKQTMKVLFYTYIDLLVHRYFMIFFVHKYGPTLLHFHIVLTFFYRYLIHRSILLIK